MKKIRMMWMTAAAVLIMGGCSNEPPLAEKEPVNSSVRGLELPLEA